MFCRFPSGFMKGCLMLLLNKMVRIALTQSQSLQGT
uniref:Uncharacterized protein n=1 Tax=Lotus japonicus TaxID=34305 RepID=I3T211_LOTJA|nr:unknown [Lotus japonicus]